MPVDFSSPEGGVPLQNDGVMFAPTPLWDRDVKKRRGRRDASSRAARDPAITAAEPSEAVYAPQSAAERTATRRRGVPTGAIAAGLAAVVAAGAIGWYASQPRNAGVAELTPGATATSQAALNTAPVITAPLNTAAPPSVSPLAAAAPPATQTASTTRETAKTTTTRASTPAVTQRSRTTTVAARAPTPRVRPAESNSALDAGVNAGATAPMISTPAPTPAPAMASAMDSVPVSPVAPTAPVTSAPSAVTPQPAAPAPADPALSSDPTVTP
ncbi:hypothetical protein LJR225_002534 [Phenylobacterium sp. LjRoot225]|uniref:hypothetical protein n=1 Tax=Phenylobacterium sp. LjRoot225 TaxID=3342285 RepID=UPI003ECF7CB7